MASLPSNESNPGCEFTQKVPIVSTTIIRTDVHVCMEGQLRNILILSHWCRKVSDRRIWQTKFHYDWQTRVSGETGALLVYSCLITYKRFSQRYQVNMMIYKGVIVNKSSSSYRLNVCSLNVSDGNYLKMVKDTQNLRPRYRKPSRRGFQIISYMFNLNVKLPLANQICCTHYMCIIT